METLSLADYFDLFTTEWSYRSECYLQIVFSFVQKNSIFNEKLSYSRQLLNNSRFVSGWYKNVCLSFYRQLFLSLEKYVFGEEYFVVARDFVMNKLVLSDLRFRVWNHLFLCDRVQYSNDMCNFCTKSIISNMKISNHIDKTFVCSSWKVSSIYTKKNCNCR